MRGVSLHHATKAELVRLTREITIAVEGLELLERRRDTLMAEGLRLLKLASLKREQATLAWQGLAGEWEGCLAHQNRDTLNALAQALTEAPPLGGRGRRWLSVELADVAWPEPALELLGAVSDVDLRAERVRGMLAGLLPQLIELMNLETNIRRISIALKHCHRQVKALTEVVIPELRREKARIEQRLEEKEREAIFQVKLLKARQR